MAMGVVMGSMGGVGDVRNNSRGLDASYNSTQESSFYPAPRYPPFMTSSPSPLSHPLTHGNTPVLRTAARAGQFHGPPTAGALQRRHGLHVTSLTSEASVKQVGIPKLSSHFFIDVQHMGNKVQLLAPFC